MGTNSNIEWTDHTFNPWIGCSKVAAGCAHCYAEAMMDHRYGKVRWGDAGTRVKTSPANWSKVRRWNREALATFGRKARVFCASLADVCEDRPELVEWRRELCELIAGCDNLNFLLLSKRPENYAAMFPREILERCWVGTSVAEQKDADRNIPNLIKTPAAVRFVSAEPLIGPVDFIKWLPQGRADWQCQKCGGFIGGKIKPCPHCGASAGYLCGSHVANKDAPGTFGGSINRQPIDWIIAGCESGVGARVAKQEWFELARDQCVAARVPYFLKQMIVDGKKESLPKLGGVSWAQFPLEVA